MAYETCCDCSECGDTIDVGATVIYTLTTSTQ